MNFRIYCTLISLLLISTLTAQKKKEVAFGKPSQEELFMKTYPDDPEAAAVELYSQGKVSVILNEHRYLQIKKVVHKKIKVLNVDRFKGATIEIPYYKEGKSGMVVKDIKAVTHYNGTMTYVSGKDIFTKDPYENWRFETFTFPNVKNGSILEYTYTVESPYFHTYEWEFQGDYPTIYSEFISEIPGNYTYRIGLFGGRKLDTHDTSVKKNCFSVDGYGDAADCTYEFYVMNNVPAFKEEDFMLARENYIARVKYELKESFDFQGKRTKHTKEWRDVDKEFRTDKAMGRQLKSKSFFGNQLPENIQTISDPLEKAKAVYYFIQDHYTWNGKYRIFSDIDVKKAFNTGSGNLAEINLSLINALRAAGLEDTQLVLSATREAGIPNQLFPVLTEFNYVMAWLKIGDNEYYLDAADKYTPFGIVPFRALNSVGRIMDFKNGSYWHPITPHKKNVIFVNSVLTIDGDGLVTGKVGEQHMGYFGRTKRFDIGSATKDDYTGEKEQLHETLEVSNLEIENFKDLEKNLKETYDIEMEAELIGNDFYLPTFFLLEYLNENPFKLESRDYLVEMGYPMIYTYLARFTLDESLSVKTLPTNKTLKLPDDAGICSVVYNEADGVIGVRLNFKLNQHEFSPEYYDALKDFFSKTVQITTKEPIVISK
ncbi:transglutaminase-like domain-containing protein [Aureisphaera galaxeae]|uniref:transglutaminase domain-containing protein n=1 Tax=Aureisphaera galaxeae TaxID=1538023 RepID=UPI00234FDE79|nr:transglutaminase-like domain-containing protein [Aureisphaera galaxeae]MDC8004441.1 transglutaminase-like domain-containing protein [Aureisphaera galaxeae]